MTWTSGCLSTRRDRRRIGKKLHVLLDTAIQQQRRSASDASDAAADDKKSRTVCSSQARRQAPPLEGRRRAGVTSIDRSCASRRPLSVAISRARAARVSVAWWQARALSHSKSKARYHGLVTAWWKEDEDWLTDGRTDDRLIDWLTSAPLQVTTVIALWLEWDLFCFIYLFIFIYFFRTSSLLLLVTVIFCSGVVRNCLIMTYIFIYFSFLGRICCLESHSASWSSAFLCIFLLILALCCLPNAHFLCAFSRVPVTSYTMQNGFWGIQLAK